MKKLLMTAVVMIITAVMMFTITACSKTNSEFKAEYKEISKQEIQTLKTNIEESDALEVEDSQLPGYQVDIKTKNKMLMSVTGDDKTSQSSELVYLDNDSDINMSYKFIKGDVNTMSAEMNITSKNSGLLLELAAAFGGEKIKEFKINGKAYYDGTNLFIDDGTTKIKTTTANYNDFLGDKIDFDSITQVATDCLDVLNLIDSGKIDTKFVKVATGDFGTKIRIDANKEVISALMGSEIEGLDISFKASEPMYFSFDKDYKLRGFDISYELTASGKKHIGDSDDSSSANVLDNSSSANVSLEIKVDAMMIPFDGEITPPADIDEYTK